MKPTLQQAESASIALGADPSAPAMDSVSQVLFLPRRSALLPERPVLRLTPRTRRTLLRVALFSALVLAVACALHALISRGLRRITTSDFGAMNQLVDGRINAQIVVTGSSRALVHYDPRAIQAATGRTAYNLGRNGSQTDLQLAVLKTYLAHNAKPALVVHNLDLFSFVTSHDIYDAVQYVPYLGEPAIYSAVRRVYPDAWKWKYAPLYGYVVPDLRLSWVLGVKRLFGLEPAQDHIDGFVPHALPWTGEFDSFRAQHPEGVRTAVEAQGVRDVEDLIVLCRDQRIPLLLVYSPEYFEMQALESNREAIFARFRELASRHGVPLWDFSDSALGRERELFYNSQHLNAEGAARFSAEFARRLAAESSKVLSEASGAASSAARQL